VLLQYLKDNTTNPLVSVVKLVEDIKVYGITSHLETPKKSNTRDTALRRGGGSLRLSHAAAAAAVDSVAAL